MPELGDNYYKVYENNDSKGEDEEKAMKRVEWKEEQEKAKKEYFSVIAEDEKEATRSKH